MDLERRNLDNVIFLIAREFQAYAVHTSSANEKSCEERVYQVWIVSAMFHQFRSISNSNF